MIITIKYKQIPTIPICYYNLEILFYKNMVLQPNKQNTNQVRKNTNFFKNINKFFWTTIYLYKTSSYKIILNKKFLCIIYLITKIWLVNNNNNYNNARLKSKNKVNSYISAVSQWKIGMVTNYKTKAKCWFVHISKQGWAYIFKISANGR